jgi:hypothetical protein
MSRFFEKMLDSRYPDGCRSSQGARWRPTGIVSFIFAMVISPKFLDHATRIAEQTAQTADVLIGDRLEN